MYQHDCHRNVASREHYNRCRGGVNSAPMMMAYMPAATAHAVAVLLSTEEAEGITASVSTVDHGNRNILMCRATRLPTYLRIASEYRIVDALPGRLDEHARQQPGPSAKRLGKVHATHASSHRIRTRNVRDRSNVKDRVTLLQEHQRLILSTIGFGRVMARLFLYSAHWHKRKDKPAVFS